MLGQICLGGEASRRMSRSRRIALLAAQIYREFQTSIASNRAYRVICFSRSNASRDLFLHLRTAGEAIGLSQRDLSARITVPQSHISKIESGGADLRLSSLVELARARP